MLMALGQPLSPPVDLGRRCPPTPAQPSCPCRPLAGPSLPWQKHGSHPGGAGDPRQHQGQPTPGPGPERTPGDGHRFILCAGKGAPQAVQNRPAAGWRACCGSQSSPTNSTGEHPTFQDSQQGWRMPLASRPWPTIHVPGTAKDSIGLLTGKRQEGAKDEG